MPNTFFYLHGFNSDADRSSDKVQILQTIGEVILLSYDSFATYDNILRSLIDSVQVEPHENPVFVGTSLGGFYAAELGKHYGLPSVLINPAWNPCEVLAEFVGQRLEMRRDLFARPAPFRPEVDDHRRRRTEHFRVEAVV